MCKLHAGPEPDSPVTASISGSLTSLIVPTARKILSQALLSSALLLLPLAYAAAHWPTRHGVFGITRITLFAEGMHVSMSAIEIPAAIDMKDLVASISGDIRLARSCSIGMTI